MATRLTALFSAVVVVLALASCSRPETQKQIELPPTPLLSVRAHWGVVKVPYARVFGASETKGPVAFILRSADIVEISAKTGYTDVVRGDRDYWYHVIFNGKEGWVFGNGLDLYDSRERAENASRLLADG